MDRLGLVAAPRRAWRDWRAYAAPVALLLAITVAVAIFRGDLRSHPSGGGAPARVVRKPAPARRKPAVYVVRAGDTVDAIAARTGRARRAAAPR